LSACRVEWPQAWRIIAARYPPIAVFERLTPHPAIWDALLALERLTNPQIRDEMGDISLVRPEDRVSDPGAGFVMGAFTHLNPKGSRFSDGSYGVYYAAADLDTAIAETVFHFENLARDSADPPRREEMRVLVGAIAETFEDLVSLPEAERARILDPNSYAAAQAFGRALREVGSNGVTYPSVRSREGGACIGAFKPRAVGLPHEERHLSYRWNGHRVDHYFDYLRDRWIDL